MMLLLLGLSWQALLAPHLTKGSSSRRHLKRASSSPPTRVEERDSRVIRKRGEKALRYCKRALLVRCVAPRYYWPCVQQSPGALSRERVPGGFAGLRGLLHVCFDRRVFLGGPCRPW